MSSRMPGLSQMFLYNDRVAAAMIPSLIVLVGLAESSVMAILVVGAMLSYILDAFRQKELALITLWVSLALTNLANLIATLTSNSPEPFLVKVSMILVSSGILFLTGCWGCLQFRYLPLQHPVIALMLENVLLTSCFPLATAALSWVIMTSIGVYHAPFYSAIIAYSLYALFGPPLSSSFLTRGAVAASANREAPTKLNIQTRLQAAAQSLLLLLLPPLLYITIHWRVIYQSEHIWSIILLACSGIIFLEVYPRALWWVPDSMKWVRRVIFSAAVLLGVAALEHRVVLAAFGQYVKIPAPWSWIAVTLGLYGAAFLAMAYFGGWIPYLDPGFVGVLVILATTAGGVSLGLPITVLPFCLGAGAGLALFQESERMEYYLMFAGGSAVCVAYFLHSHFWFLDIDLDGLHVHTLCKLIACAIVPTLLLPGFIRLQLSPALCATALIVQAALVAFMEEHMYAGDHEDELYPAYLVCATSAMGLALVRRLQGCGYISARASWACQCTYVAKLCMLLIPSARLVVPAAALLLSASPPFFFYRALMPDPKTRPTGHKGSHMMAHAVSVLVAVMYSRFAIFDVVQAFIGGAPPEGLLIGCLVLTAAVCLSPLVYICYPNSSSLKRNLFLVYAAGAMLVLLRPPLPVRGGAACPKLPFHLCPRIWDERHRPSHEVDDISIYGEGLSRREHWPLWILLVSVILAMLSATLPLSHKGGSMLAQLGLGVAAAVGAGAYIALEFLPGQLIIQVVMMTATLLVGAFLVLLRSPTAHNPAGLSVIPIVWMFLFPVAMMLQATLPLPDLPSEATRLFPDETRVSVDLDRRSTAMASIYSIYAVQGLLLALILKIKTSAAFRGRDKAGPGNYTATPGTAYASQTDGLSRAKSLLESPILSGIIDTRSLTTKLGKMVQMDSVGTAGIARLSAQGLAWMPSVGNLITFFVFGLGLVLNFRVGDGLDEGIFALAPILLLLNQDPIFLRKLEDKRRYYIPCLAAVVYLYVVSILQVIDLQHMEQDEGVLPVLEILKGLACTLCTVPTLTMFIVYLWHRRKQSEWPLLFFTPLNIIPAVFSSTQGPWLLSIAAFVGVAVQFLAMRHVRRKAMQLI